MTTLRASELPATWRPGDSGLRLDDRPVTGYPNVLVKFNEHHDDKGRFAEGEGHGFPTQGTGEDVKAYRKRLAAALPTPETLPEHHDAYFLLGGPHVVVPTAALQSSKTDAENVKGGTNAAKFMWASAQGIIPKRVPISVRDDGDGHYTVLDGNGTLTAVRHYGWQALPVQVVEQVAKNNPYHDERGRFTTGPGGAGAGTTEDQHAALRDMASRMGTGADWKNPPFIMGEQHHTATINAYLNAHGQEWTAQKLPAGVKRGRMGACYDNATQLVLMQSDLRYCEGVAYTGRDTPFAYLHAWAVDKDGKVVDPTWDQPEKARYFGVAYDTHAYMAHMLRGGYYGVLGGNPKTAAKVMKKGGL